MVIFQGEKAQQAFAEQKNLDKNAYFGDTHLHPSWSVNASLFGNRITEPDDAFRYAQGQIVKQPLG